MSEREMSQYLPWMCAGLVLSVELWTKGAFTAFVVGASSLALFALVLGVLKHLGSVESDSARAVAAGIDGPRDEIVFEPIQVPTAILKSLGASQSR